MTTVLEFNRCLHELPLAFRGYLQLVEHMYSQHHGRQLRDSGEPYVEHLCDVMRQILEIESRDPINPGGKLPWYVVVSGGLHDIIEDTAEEERPVTYEMIEMAFGAEDRDFGRKVAFIVCGVSKKPKREFDSKDARLAEYRQRLLWAAEKDYHVIVVKLADRRHNLFTLHGLSFDPSKQQRIAQETLEFYCPLALERAKNLVPPGFHWWLDECAHQMKCVALAFLNGKYHVEYSSQV